MTTPNNSDQAAMHDELRALLPSLATLDAVDDNNRSGRRPCPLNNFTIADVRNLHAALTLPASEAVAELVSAATDLRQRQRDYLSGPKSERSEDKGKLVGVAAARVDAALVPFRLAAMSAATDRALLAVSGEYPPISLPTPPPSPAAHAGGEAVACVRREALNFVSDSFLFPPHMADAGDVLLYTHPSPMPVDALREKLQELREEVSVQQSLMDHYQDWDDANRLFDQLTALLSGGAAREGAK